MLLELRDVSFSYMHNTPLSHQVLRSIDLSLCEGEFVALIGPTGSGKSTLIQHFNGLLSPTRGKVFVQGKELGTIISAGDVRKLVGLVFQFPENQLFAETVFDDVAFGPRNLGFSDDEVAKAVHKALETVGLHPGRLLKRSPFSLSGGEMRKVAVAGVLAMRPRILVLDEPTAGMDASGRREILSYLKYLHKRERLTVVLVSHNMDEIAAVAERVVILDKGQVVTSGRPAEVFKDVETLKRVGLDVPQTTALLISLQERGVNVETNSLSLGETKDIIVSRFVSVK